MTWQVLIGISVLCFAFSTILQKILLRNEKTDPMAFSIVFQLITGIFIGLFGWITIGFKLPDLSPLILNLALMTLLYALGNVFLFKSLQKIDASVFAVIFSGRALFTILASSILLKEGLSLNQFAGTVLILASIVLVTLKSTKLTFSRYELFALLAAVCFGLETTNDRMLLGRFEIYSYVFLAFVIPSLFTVPLYPRSILKMGEFLRVPLALKMSLLCIIYATSAITFFTALQIGNNSSQIASINLTAVIVTVLLSVVILKEREIILRKIAGAILSFFGILLLG